MNKRSKLVLAIYAGFALLYLLLIPFRPVPLDFVVKAVPVLTLSAWLLTSVRGWIGKALSFAMLLSAGGDVTLALLSDENPELFMVGLLFFLAAHIVFIVVFLSNISVKSRTAPVALVFPVFSVGMAWLLAPQLGEMTLPVFVYIGIISLMGIIASLNQRGKTLLLAGAILFVLSDSAIAVNKFLVPVPGASYFIMISYYLAQYFIAWSFIKTEPEVNEQ